MYSFVVFLASIVYVIECSNSDVIEYVRNYKKEVFRGLFDRVELPLEGVLPTLNRKVFNAKRVSIREHPYVVSIRRNVAHYSTGCILTKNIVLSVAHPLINVSIAELGVVVGENYSDRGATMLTIILIIIHEKFNPAKLENDIALLRTFEDITYRGSAKSIPLIRDTESINGYKAFVTGWGRCDRTGRELCLPRSTRYHLGEKLDPMLKTINFIVEENATKCHMYQHNDVYLPPSVLCLGVARENNPVASCMAVPGAPLVVKAHLAGLLSWGFGCGRTRDLPLIYMSIKYYLPWLTHNISVLRKISKVYLLKLFQAKRAYILKQWLNFTRIVPPPPDKDNGKHMAILLVDSDLAKLHGDVYDIRDYLYNGIHHNYKFKAYKKIRHAFALESSAKLKLESIKESFKKLNDSLRPFISDNSDKSDVETVADDENGEYEA